MKFNFAHLVSFFAMAMAFFLPLHIGLSNLFLILFFVGSGYFLFIKKEYVKRKPSLLIYTLLPFFLLYVIGVFYSEPPFIGTKVMGRTIAFLLCPLLLLFYPKSVLQRVKSGLFKGIVAGSIISVGYLLINNFLNYFATRPFLKFDDEILSYYYTYHYFTKPLEIYPTYLGAYVLFALVILLKQVLTGKKAQKNLKWAAIGLLSIGVLFISARIILFLYAILVAACFGYGIFLLFKQKKYMPLIGSVCILVIIVFLGVKSLSQTFVVERFANELEWELSEQINTTYNNKNDADSRIARWNSALQAISERPVFGYGTYTEKEILADFYLKNNLMVSYNNRYDAHNLYLSFSLEYGIVGLALFLFFLISNLIFAIRQQDLEFFFLFFMIVAISFFESYLQNNAAITFVALFGTVMFFSNLPNSKKNGYVDY